MILLSMKCPNAAPFTLYILKITFCNLFIKEKRSIQKDEKNQIFLKILTNFTWSNI